MAALPPRAGVRSDEARARDAPPDAAVDDTLAALKAKLRKETEWGAPLR